MKKMGKSVLGAPVESALGDLRKHQQSKPVDLSDEMIGNDMVEMSGHEEYLVDIFRELGYQIRSPTKQEYLKWAAAYYDDGPENAKEYWNRLEEYEGIKYGAITHLILEPPVGSDKLHSFLRKLKKGGVVSIRTV
jgi:hypothetical protein